MKHAAALLTLILIGSAFALEIDGVAISNTSKTLLTTAKVADYSYAIKDPLGVEILTRTVVNSIDTRTNTLRDCDLLTCDYKIQIKGAKGFVLSMGDVVGKYVGGTAKAEKVFHYENRTIVLERPVYKIEDVRYNSVTCTNESSKNDTKEYTLILTDEELAKDAKLYETCKIEPFTVQNSVQTGTENYTEVQTYESKDDLVFKTDDVKTVVVRFTKTKTTDVVDIYDMMFGKSFSDAAWWNNSWNFKKQVNVTNWLCNASNCQFPVYVGLNTTATNGSGIRVVNSAENALLDFWRDDYWNYTNASGKLWINASNATSMFYIYYNASGVSDASSIDNTFLFGDDFSGTLINTTKWYVLGNNSGQYAMSGGIMQIKNSNIFWGVNLTNFPITTGQIYSVLATGTTCGSDDCHISFYGYQTDFDSTKPWEHSFGLQMNTFTVSGSKTVSIYDDTRSGTGYVTAADPTFPFGVTMRFANTGVMGNMSVTYASGTTTALGYIPMASFKTVGFGGGMSAGRSQTANWDYYVITSPPMAVPTFTFGAQEANAGGTGNLTVNATVGGSATGNNSTFTPPANLTINATATAGYYFVNWTTNCNGAIASPTNANTQIQVNDATSCYAQANFANVSLSVAFVSQTPSDITSLNVVNTPLGIQYNITTSGGTINTSSVLLYYKTNNSLNDISAYHNGTADTGWEFDIVGTNASELWNWSVGDNEIYPHTENIQDSVFRNQPRNQTALTTANDYYSTEYLNVSNTTPYGFYEQMWNASTAAGVRVYACNQTYDFSSIVATSPNCVQLASIVSNGAYDHTHNQSGHRVVPFVLNSTTGTIAGSTVKVTPKMYFMIRGNNGATVNVSQISTQTRVSTTKTTINNGNTWTNRTYTADGHLHQYYGNDTFHYYVCANTTIGIGNCSAIRDDLLDLAGLPPSAPSVYSPNNTTYYRNAGTNVWINYTASISPNGYPILYYNITLRDENNTITSIIIENNSANLSYSWNISNVSFGQHTVGVRAYDNNSQSTAGVSQIFTIDNSAPNVTAASILTAPFYKNSTLFGWANVSYIVNATLNVTYKWFLNGAANATGSLNVSSGVYTNVANITTGLAKGQNWTLQINASDGTSSTVLNSSVATILNSAPSVPAQVSPASGSTISAGTANLTWNASTDIDGDTLSYTVCYGTTNATSNCTNTTGTSYVITLSASTTYFWKVLANDSTNISAYSPIWNFTSATPPIITAFPLPQPFIYGDNIGCEFNLSSLLSTINVTVWLEKGDGTIPAAGIATYNITPNGTFSYPALLSAAYYAPDEYWRCGVNATGVFNTTAYSTFYGINLGEYSAPPAGGGGTSGGITPQNATNVTAAPTFSIAGSLSDKLAATSAWLALAFLAVSLWLYTTVKKNHKGYMLVFVLIASVILIVVLMK